MKLLQNRSFIKKILIALVITILCNFSVPIYSQAFSMDDVLDYTGDIVTTSVGFLLEAVGRSVMKVLQYSLLGYSMDADNITLSPDTIFANKIQLLNPDYIVKSNKNEELELEIKTALDQTKEKLEKYHEYYQKTGKEWNDPQSFIEVISQPGNFEKLVKQVKQEEEQYTEVYRKKEAARAKIKDFYEENLLPNHIPVKYTEEEYSQMETALVLETDNIEAEYLQKSLGSQLKTTISKWYYTLRNFAIVAMLSILVYVAIRIILSSVSQDKAKYKQMLIDWLIGVCLIFVLHYIMAFITGIINNITEALNAGDTTNLMSNIADSCYYASGVTKLGYGIMFVALVFMTGMFVIYYLRRAITLAFLTIIAPLVAMTYPIDKISDGKSQAFDMWLKDYIFNSLIQPLHLLLYTILVSSAINLATQNILYSCVALYFIKQAEGILRRFFGFDSKAPGVGKLGGLAGLALAGTAVKSLAGKPHQGTKTDRSNLRSGGNESGSDNKPIRQKGSAKDLSEFHNNDGDDVNNATDLDSGSNASFDSDSSPDSNSDDKGKEIPDYGEDFERQNRYKQLEDEGIIGEEADNIVQNELGDKNTSRSPIDKDGTDYQRAVRARELRSQGLSPDEVTERLNQELPFDRYNNNQEQNNNENDNNQSKKPNRSKKTLRFARNTGKYTGKALKQTARAGAKVIGAGVRATGAVTGAAVGVAAGIATGNVMQSAVTGATVGAGVSGRVINTTARATSGIEDVASKTLNKTERHRMNKQYENFVNKNKQKFKDEYGRDYKNKLEEAREYTNAGITDFDKIKKGFKIADRNNFNNRQAINILQMNDKIGSSILDENESKEHRKSIREAAGKKDGDRIIAALKDVQTGMVGKPPRDQKF